MSALTDKVPVKPSRAACNSLSNVENDCRSCLLDLQHTGAPATQTMKPPTDTSSVAAGANEASEKDTIVFALN